ncbi:amidohydrolase family protein [Streptomyces sp. RS2]|uniref:amidohydrolase family protein n=1 Tax=Streptomyces sp. RS2 TaxID=1451205 RepID=UPI0021F8F5FC|nr:amidohydrolase family protein [Streptomyces sp. RS2]MCW1097091.1 amidohydrolase family protein [Streptomyces sp. RS2]
MSRRGFLAGAGAGAAVALTSLAGPSAVAAGPRTGGTGDLRLGTGTTFGARVSPDGRWIAHDLLGVLWVMPASGGPARRLTSDLFDVAQPDWSPDGSRLVFQSYRDGVFNLWTVRPDGSGLRRLTEGPFDHREPRWSPDGRTIVFSGDASGSYAIQTYDVGSGRIDVLADGSGEEYEPAWSPDGEQVAFVVDNTRIEVVDRTTGRRGTRLAVPAGQVIHQPEWTPDGAGLVHHLTHDGRCRLMTGDTPLVEDQETFPFRVSWLDGERFLYTADGRIHVRSLHGPGTRTIGFSAAVTTRRPRYTRRRSDFESTGPRPVRGIGSPVLSPDGEHVAFRALNDIYVMKIGRAPRPLTRDHWWKCDPAWSPDGKLLAYSTDRGGTLDLWIRDLATGRDRQLTDLGTRAALSAAWSPDGKELAFLDQDGALWTADAASGDVRQVFTATFEPGRPTWSPDGRTIALAAVKPYSARFREGLSQILLVDRATGRGRYVEAVPGRSIQTRGDDGPVWSPDGRRMAFAVASVLYTVDVAADGTPVGEPRQLTDEVTDAPSWSGDSKHLLYLNNGRLRLVPARGGRPRTLAVPLTWTAVRPPARTVVHAGRMWDGVRREIRRDVDIVVEGHRIRAVEPHADGRAGQRVDARDRLVMPGLVDMHHHREMQGYAYGDRQGRLWLSLGVTTTRSPGSPAYHMVEEREATRSGARIAPRYFATGEAVDGPRIYYNFMRPTFDDAQLKLELERARSLEYDLMKCYVRLPVAWHKRVIAFAHGVGIPATSHYHYPAAALGGDGTEHTGATNRFGYSRTVTPLGTGYSDVTDLFVASGMARTPTLFGSTTLYREDRSLVEDRRVRTLNPPWRLAALQESADAAARTDQSARRENLRAQVRQALDLFRRGGRVVAGTDAPIDHAAVSLHMNLRAMVTYGFTPYEALTTATGLAGETLHEDLGCIAPGMYADLAVVDGDPLADIKDAANVEQVFVSGIAHTVDSLMRPFAEPPAAGLGEPDGGSTVLPPVPEHPANDAFWWHGHAYVEEARHACCSG